MPAARGALIEDGQQTALQLGAARHGDSGRGAGGPRLQGPRDFEQVAGVIAGHGTGTQDEIVGGAFAFFEELAPHGPGEGVPPVQGERGPRQQMGGGVAAQHVSQFVEQDDAAPFAAPCARFLGQ